MWRPWENNSIIRLQKSVISILIADFLCWFLVSHTLMKHLGKTGEHPYNKKLRVILVFGNILDLNSTFCTHFQPKFEQFPFFFLSKDNPSSERPLLWLPCPQHQKLELHMKASHIAYSSRQSLCLRSSDILDLVVFIVLQLRPVNAWFFGFSFEFLCCQQELRSFTSYIISKIKILFYSFMKLYIY